ncbi:MAG: FkbM family methyltransferase [Acidobacteriota bacterium]|nr:FkbM family methyltransferase [Acidobacteriota bacterium]
MKQSLKTAFRHIGVEVTRINSTATTACRRLTMMRHERIDTVIDVGANVGQYASELRESGYGGDIFSFEPLSQAFADLSKKAHGDANWRLFQTAIGAENGEAEINISRNSFSSSLLPMLETHIQAAPESRYLSTAPVSVRTLDTALQDIPLKDRRALLKIDTQGYEEPVLRGAANSLRQVYLVECELSLVPLYEGQCLFLDMVDKLAVLGFSPVHFEPAFVDEATGYCLQIDGIFARSH